MDYLPKIISHGKVYHVWSNEVSQLKSNTFSF